MGSFGERLEQERTKRGVTLKDMADATKISARMLRALETEDFDKLPGGIFNRGFVRAYARHLGLDPEAAVADYISAEGGRRNGSTSAPAAATVDSRPARDPGRLRPLLRLGLILILVVGAGWAVIHYATPLRAVWQRLTTHRKALPAPMTRPAPAPPEQAQHSRR